MICMKIKNQILRQRIFDKKKQMNYKEYLTVKTPAYEIAKRNICNPQE